MDLLNLMRENIKELAPYSTARDDCKIPMEIYLDANENPYNNEVNRYPSPFQHELKRYISLLKGIESSNIFLGNGSDEVIDLIYRVFCEPKESSVVIVSPTYGMYGVAAKINNVRIIESFLNDRFELDAESVLKDTEEDTKVIFICSPNNPSGNLLKRDEIEKIIANFNGIVAVDEAYIDFAATESFSKLINKYPNLIVLQTLSKAWGMAGLRIGIAIANELTTKTFDKVKYPYNISTLNQQRAVEILRGCLASTLEKIDQLKSEREKLSSQLSELKCVEKVFPSDSNFILVRFKEKERVFNTLYQQGIIVRDRSSLPLCCNCLRITVGTPEENGRLVEALSQTPVKVADRQEESRNSTIIRETKETSIQISVNLDNFSPPFISTGLHFFNHMLEQIAYHGAIGMKVLCAGDLSTDDHHTIEDTAIALGAAILQALGDKSGIERYGFSLPMDETEATVLLDLGGRTDFAWDVKFTSQKIGDVNSQMFAHFFKSLSENMRCNLHIKATGENDHHIIEGVFKAFARALKSAIHKENNNRIASSKCVL